MCVQLLLYREDLYTQTADYLNVDKCSVSHTRRFTDESIEISCVCARSCRFGFGCCSLVLCIRVLEKMQNSRFWQSDIDGTYVCWHIFKYTFFVIFDVKTTKKCCRLQKTLGIDLDHHKSIDFNYLKLRKVSKNALQTSHWNRCLKISKFAFGAAPCYVDFCIFIYNIPTECDQFVSLITFITQLTVATVFASHWNTTRIVHRQLPPSTYMPHTYSIQQSQHKSTSTKMFTRIFR